MVKCLDMEILNVGIQNWLLLIVGFYLLVQGAEFLIDGAIALARRFGLSDLIIALTLVAFGTSAPEFGVNLFAGFTENYGIALGNVIGSNIVNLALILGLAGLVRPLTVRSQTVWKELPMLILVSLLMLLLASDQILTDSAYNAFSLADGLVLILFFGFYLGYIVHSAIAENGKVKLPIKLEHDRVWLDLIKIIGGTTGLMIGGGWIVDSASMIAAKNGVSQSLIGLLIAIGTSLPELATSIVAAVRKNSDIAVGNLVGSNIFNITWVLAISIVLNPVQIDNLSIVNMYWMIGFNLILMIFLSFRNKNHCLHKGQSVFLIMLYCCFIVYNFVLKAPLI
jgi:cation:H+ antiporter